MISVVLALLAVAVALVSIFVVSEIDDETYRKK